MGRAIVVSMTRTDLLTRLWQAERDAALWWKAQERPDLYPDAKERHDECQRRAYALARRISVEYPSAVHSTA